MSTRQKRYCIILNVIFIIIIMMITPLVAQNREGLSLKQTFNLYVKYVQESDLKNLFTTVTDNESLLFLTSKGELINTRKGYYRFHEDWFKEKGWEMPVELLQIHEGKEFGYTTAIFHYKSDLNDGTTYVLDSYFTLIFHKENNMWKVVADICTPISRYIVEKDSKIKYDSDQIYLFNIIKNRRTVRKFKSTPVPKEHILKIIDAARMAPTAGNQQPWKFLVIRDRKKLNKLEKQALVWYIESYSKKRNVEEEELKSLKSSLRSILNNVLSAPVYIAVLVDTKSKYPDYIDCDGTLAAGYLMIAARSLGYGTGFFTTFFPEDKMKEFFNIPDRYKLICFTPVGIPDQWPKTPDKKSVDDVVVFESFK